MRKRNSTLNQSTPNCPGLTKWHTFIFHPLHTATAVHTLTTPSWEHESLGWPTAWDSAVPKDNVWGITYRAYQEYCIPRALHTPSVAWYFTQCIHQVWKSRLDHCRCFRRGLFSLYSSHLMHHHRHHHHHDQNLPHCEIWSSSSSFSHSLDLILITNLILPILTVSFLLLMKNLYSRVLEYAWILYSRQVCCVA